MKRKELGMEFVEIVQRNHYEFKRKKRRKLWRNTIGIVIAGCILIPATIYAGSAEFKPNPNVTSIPQNYYAGTMVVHEVDHVKNLVCIKNPLNGICYSFRGINGWNVGDVCTALMDSLGTQNPKDDVIVDKWNSDRNLTFYADNERS